MKPSLSDLEARPRFFQGRYRRHGDIEHHEMLALPAYISSQAQDRPVPRSFLVRTLPLAPLTTLGGEASFTPTTTTPDTPTAVGEESVMVFRPLEELSYGYSGSGSVGGLGEASMHGTTVGVNIVVRRQEVASRLRNEDNGDDWDRDQKATSNQNMDEKGKG